MTETSHLDFQNDLTVYYDPPHKGGGRGQLSDDARLKSVCLSRTSGLSRGIGAEIGHVTRDSDGHHFQGQKDKGQLAGGGGI